MACGWAAFSPFRAFETGGYVCAGVPPEKEVAPAPARSGRVVAALVRILRSVLPAQERR